MTAAFPPEPIMYELWDSPSATMRSNHIPEFSFLWNSHAGLYILFAYRKRTGQLPTVPENDTAGLPLLNVRVPQEQGFFGSGRPLTDDTADLLQAHGRIPDDFGAHIDLFSREIDERECTKIVIVVMTVNDPSGETGGALAGS